MKPNVLVLATLGLLLVPWNQAHSDFMYWTQGSTIQGANLDGTGRITLASGVGEEIGIAVDVAGGKIYWASELGGILRANLDGSGIQTVIGHFSGYSIALDVAEGKMYFGASEGIYRSNLNGTGLQFFYTGGSDSPAGIALDVTAGKIYWAEQFGSSIWRANLDGTAQQEVVTGLTEPQNVAVDDIDGKIYWTDYQGGIWRANLGGNGVQLVISTGSPYVSGIALDVAADKIYYSSSTGGIDRANLDGTDQQLVVANASARGIAIAFGVNVVPEPSSLTLSGIAILIMLGYGLRHLGRFGGSILRSLAGNTS